VTNVIEPVREFGNNVVAEFKRILLFMYTILFVHIPELSVVVGKGVAIKATRKIIAIAEAVNLWKKRLNCILKGIL
jgi:hypothetical protein